MKSNRLTIRTLQVLTILCLRWGPVLAEDTFWGNNGGNWLSPQYWNPIMPSFADSVYVVGSIDLAAGAAAAGHVWLTDIWGSTMNHTGGSLKTNTLNIADEADSRGTYYLSGTANLDAGSILIGNYGTGVFFQDGGTNRAGNMTLGYKAGSSGTYRLSAGDLLIDGNLIVAHRSVSGLLPASTGSFAQTGGAVTVGGNITLALEGPSSGEYALLGGILKTAGLRIGYYGHGSFYLVGQRAAVTVTDHLFVGLYGQFAASPGSVIRMDGAYLDNWSNNPANLDGLNNLTLSFEKGTQQLPLTFEVAGADRGPDEQWFQSNFALDGLIVGDLVPANVRLVNFRDNVPGRNEALYVKAFRLGSGSRLDLNGLNLYCLNFNDLGGTIDLNGGRFVLVPEPASLLLLILGVPFAQKRR